MTILKTFIKKINWDIILLKSPLILSAFERIIMMYFNLYICVSIMEKKWWQPYYIEPSISLEGMNKELQMRIQIREKNVHEK